MASSAASQRFLQMRPLAEIIGTLSMSTLGPAGGEDGGGVAWYNKKVSRIPSVYARHTEKYGHKTVCKTSSLKTMIGRDDTEVRARRWPLWFGL